MTGRLLAGRYELGEVVGQGGMALVYRATDRALGRDVAVKVLRDQFAEDPEIVARFEREARSAARLAHPNVVDIYDVGQDGPTQFIVMELVEGENLKSLIRREAPLSPARVIRLGRDIAAALEFAHRRGLVHRDVKPQNVVLDMNGRARLTDFGIAQAADAASLTQTGTVLGTAQYMAPEQARGRGATAASDLYSLGVVLYELATGQPPFEGGPALSVALRHVQEAPRPPRQLNPNLPPQLEAVILKLLAKEPARRFGSAAELAEALAGTLQPAREPTARVAVVDRPPGAGDARVRGGATRVGRPPAAPPRPRPAPPRRPPGGSGLGLLLGLVVLSVLALAVGFVWLFGSPRPSSPTTAATPTTRPAVEPTPIAPPILAAPTPQPTEPVPTLPPAASPAPTVAPTATTARPAAPTARPTVAPTATAVVRVPVPGLVGRSLGEAQAELSNRGLALEFEIRSDPNRPEGVVLAQQPAAGETVPPRSVVRLVINRPPMVVVPNVQGLDEPDARRELQKQGFNVSAEPVSSGRKGVVNDQSPQPGIRVPPGTVVKIFVGS